MTVRSDLDLLDRLEAQLDDMPEDFPDLEDPPDFPETDLEIQGRILQAYLKDQDWLENVFFPWLQGKPVSC